MWLGALLSSLVLALGLLAAAPLRAHEVQPAVGDLTIEGRALTLVLEATLEPLIAGVDLDGLLDTNASARAAETDRLRALPPAELEQAFRAFWPRMQERLDIRSSQARVVPRLDGVDILPVGDTALPRLSRLRLSAELPPGDAPVTLAWPAAWGALALRQMGAGPDGYTGYLSGGAETDPIPRSGGAARPAWRVFVEYVGVGYEHIVPKGLDHILFVLGLFFLSLQLSPLLWQISAFTLAHTVTLALGMLGLVAVPAAVVEPLIAASIVYVGVENVLSRGLSPWRPAVVFLFGLLHGLGFAAVLGEIGVTPAQFATGLIGFNVGVELGQLSVIAGAFLLVGAFSRDRDWYRSRIANPASVLIALVGAWWVLDRTIL